MHRGKIVAIFTFFLLSSVNSYSQRISSFFKLSGPEKWWTVKHIFIANKTFKLSSSVVPLCDSLMRNHVLSGNGNGDQVDAFRHTYWMALLVQHIRPSKAIALGIAHEKGNYKSFLESKTEDGIKPDSVSSVMDLFNNDIGKKLGIELKSRFKSEGTSAIIQEVIDLVKKGGAVVLMKDKDGNFLTCDRKLIAYTDYSNKWGIPKCMVESNSFFP